VCAELGLAQLGVLPVDRRAAEELREGRAGRRNVLIRAAQPSAATIAAHIAARVAA